MMVWNLKSVRHMVLIGVLFSGLSACGYGRYLPEEGRRPPQSKSVLQAQLPVISSQRISQNPSLYYRNLNYRYVTVLPGDTISKIAGRNTVPVQSVMALNSSRPPFVIYVGQQIKVPDFKIHQVQGGETLYAISRVYDVDMGEVVHFNLLRAPYTLSPGRALKIPQMNGGETRVASVGKTGWAVSGAANNTRPPNPKTHLTIPTRSQKSFSGSSLPAPTLKTPNQSVKSAPIILRKPAAVASVQPLQTIEAVGDVILNSDLPPVPRHRYSIKQPPRRSGKIFIWPAKGPVVSAFGKKDTGFHNDGINIKLSRGTPIQAAENGVVSYVGNEMRSFGNLILISHADGYVTTYGHIETTNVQKGEAVRKGDVIATAGATGDVTTAQLHFEIRKNGEATNPMRLLARR